MKLISESEYARLNSTKPILPLSRDEKGFHEKNNQASHILDLDVIPDDIKLALYNKLVHNIHNELKTLKDKQILQVPVTENLKKSDKLEDTSYEDHMLDTFPESIRKTSKTLMYLLKQHPNIISWDRSGKMTFYNVESTRGANLHDLFSFVLRPTLKFSENPPGAKTFLHILEYLNIQPRYLE